LAGVTSERPASLSPLSSDTRRSIFRLIAEGQEKTDARTQGDKNVWLLFIFAAKTVLCFKMVAQSRVRILANRERKQGLSLGNKLATNILTSLLRRIRKDKIGSTISTTNGTS
jgi:hypothetical protein